MGIDYDAVAVFGVSYSYEELKNFINHEETNKLAEKIGCCDLVNLWVESNYVQASPYYDADESYCSYLIGYKIQGDISPDKIKEILNKCDDIKKEIREFSEKYNVVNKENEIALIIRPNVW